MHRYIAKSGNEYVIYQGAEGPQRHPDSAGYWFFVPAILFGTTEAFNSAYHTAAEAEYYCEDRDIRYVRIAAILDEEMERIKRRPVLRVVRSSE